ncbi:MAG: hypothetical protein IPL46_18945 [Saprospiraceae bacterium]|nr:hypothetical protein [Saprospiraceae bacterium]
MTSDAFSRGVPLALALSLSLSIYAQDDITNEIAKVVYMDSIVVKASKVDFSVSDFIDLVRNDASFYIAFQNLRAAAYHFETMMMFFDRKNRKAATYSAEYHQYIENGCRYQVKSGEKIEGAFFKKRKETSNFYTYDLFDRLFLVHDTTCNVRVLPQEIQFDGYGVEGHVAELKKLIFAPGTQSDVPFIGQKTEIFSEKMRDRYNFYISSIRYLDQIEAYVFDIRLKPEYQEERNNKTVIKELTTFFSKKDFQVLGRTYRLAHYKPFYQFDVSMQILLQKINERYYPAKIDFDGFWNIPMKRKETSSFTVDFKVVR